MAVGCDPAIIVGDHDRWNLGCKNIDMDDPNAKFVMGSDGNSIFNLSSDEFMEKYCQLE